MASETHVKEWVANLANHRAGRILASHLACVEAQDEIHDPDGAIQEALSNERVLVYALARSIQRRKPFPCGLSASLPMFLAVLNLSGERTLVYSDSPALIRVLCARSLALHRGELEKALKFFEDYPKDRTEDAMKFVILSYSMPWQAGTDSEYWHLSACSVDAVGELDVKLTDRIKHFASTAATPCAGVSVMEPRMIGVPKVAQAGETTLRMVSDTDIVRFCDSYSATCLDKLPEPIAEVEATTDASAASEKVAQLRSVIDGLQRGRKADQQENRELKEQLRQLTDALNRTVNEACKEEKEQEEKHKAESNEVLRAAQEKLDLARTDLANLRLEVGTAEAERNKALRKEAKTKKLHEALQAKHALAERQGAAKDALHNAALSQHVATISRLEGLLASSGEKAAAERVDLERSHATALQCADEAHVAAMQKITLALESKERICNQLSENNERRNVEVESHRTHQAEQDMRIADLEAQIKILNQKLLARPKPVATRNASIGTKKNASTSTHQCASTQTDKPPAVEKEVAAEAVTERKAASTNDEEEEEEPQQPAAAALAVGAKVMVDRSPSPLLTYQSALDMLQELVTASGNAYVPQMVPMHHVQMQMQMPYTGYPRPLPFPNFVPANGYHEPKGHAPPRYSPNQRRGYR
tara:strand:- start:263 stop:2206 length:1944 start_codon:yes stop_codon:yes gene_type:complete